jgi:hypothetical protein
LPLARGLLHRWHHVLCSETHLVDRGDPGAGSVARREVAGSWTRVDPPIVAIDDGDAEATHGERDRLTATRTYRGPPEDLVATTVRVWHSPPFNLRLHQAIGLHPVDGGTLVFRVPEFRGNVDGSGFGALPYAMERLGIRELRWTMGRRDGDAIACTLTADLDGALSRGRRAHAVHVAALAAVGLVLGGAASLDPGWLPTGLSAVLGALALLLVGRWSLPRVHAYWTRRVVDLLSGLLAEVAVDQRVQAVLAGLPLPRRTPRAER